MGWFGFGKKDTSITTVEPELNYSENESQAWFSRVKSGLNKTSSRLNEGFKNIFVRTKIDKEMLESLEETLLMADIGLTTASYICNHLEKEKFDKEITVEEVKQFLANDIIEIIQPFEKPITIHTEHKPHVILMCGVNGTGKTTTIGKLAYHYQQQGIKVMVAACDTFRAAAVDQLKVWADRAHVPIFTGKADADPASVAFEAIQRAKEENIDLLFIDTAGRLHNKKNLMEQLAKVIRVIKKADDTAPHDCIIVLDATTGQNAQLQVKTFKEITPLSGIIITKLDGTAKGGIVVSLVQDFSLPIHAIGVGEAIEDLQPFNAKNFTHSLLDIN
jgi:fused signal recognition particle receptor